MKKLSISMTLAALTSLPGCGEAGPPPEPTGVAFGEKHSGQYHEGPVDFRESAWHNACAPAGGYRSELRDTVGLYGEYIAGVSNQLGADGSLCDACIEIETERGNSIVARLVTYGVHQSPGDIDVSPSVFAAIHEGEYPRTMQWRLTACPPAGNIVYEFQEASHAYWTSLWVRNARLPLRKVEVKRQNEKSFTALERGTDGTLTRGDGFGDGAFTLRLTAIDGQVLEEELPGFSPGALIDSKLQFE
jgi:hypothetical protein